MVDIPDDLVINILLPYLINDKETLYRYLDLFPEKRPRYLKGAVSAFLERSVNDKVAEYFVNEFFNDEGDNIKLFGASKEGHLPIIQYLVEAKADIHAYNDNALRLASKKGHLSVVQYLVEVKADIHARDDWVLRWATNNGHLPVVQYLVEAKANIHAENDCALRWATNNGHLPVVQYLVEAKANIHAANDCALQWARLKGQRETVDYLRSIS